MRATITSWLLLVALGTTAAAGEMARIGNVTIHDPWARASLGTSKTSAVYMTLEIKGDQTDRLVAAETPLAEQAGMHTNIMDGGVARMRPVDAVEVAPGTPSVLRPGGLHIMLTGLKEELVEGGTLPLTLTFEQAGSVQIKVPVLGLAAGMEHSGSHGAHHGFAKTH
jgi:periplasmic copper chaperone A